MPKQDTSREQLESDLNSLATQLETYWADRDNEIKKLRELTFLTESPNLPTVGDMPVVRSPLAYEAIRTQLGHLASNMPQITVSPLSEGDRDREAAQQVERWLLGVVARLAEAEPYWDMALWNALADGLGVLKATWLPWSDFPVAAEGESAEDYNRRVEEFASRAPLPFALHSVDPLAYYPLYDPLGLAVVVEKGQRSQLWASATFGLGWDKSGRMVIGATQPISARVPGATVSYCEVWTRTHVYYIVQNRLVKEEQHGYPEIPYFEIEGETTGVREPDKRRKAYIWPYLFLQPLYDTLLNVVGHHALREGHPSFYEVRSVDSPGGALDAGTKPLYIPLGGILPGTPGSQLMPLNPQPLSPVIVQVMGLVASLLDRTGGNPILGGYSPGSRTPGVAAALFMDAAKARLQSTGRSAGLGLKRALRFFLWLIPNRIGQPVSLLSLPDSQRKRGLVSLTPANASRFADFDVDVALTLPQDDYGRHMDAINMRNNKLWSTWRAMERTGVEDPRAEMERIEVEEFVRSEPMRAYRIQQAMKKRGIGEALAEGEAAQEIVARMAQGEMPGGMGAPAGGPMAEPPVGGPVSEAPEGGLGVGQPGNIPITSIAPRAPGLTYPLTPSGPGRPAMRAPRPRGRPRGG